MTEAEAEAASETTNKKRLRFDSRISPAVAGQLAKNYERFRHRQTDQKQEQGFLYG